MAINLDDLPLAEALPAIPEGWRYESLGNLVDERGVSYGIVQPGSASAEGVPIVRVNNIRDGRIDTSVMLKVAPDIESKFKRSRLRGGEVLLTLVGTLGEVAVVPEKLRGWNVARAVGVIPVRKEPGSAWVSICLRSAFVQLCIRTWATSTVQATFNLRDLSKLPIPLPPKKTREAIVAVLGALDEKIESNQRMNLTLEAMARAQFQSWFMDFDPILINAEERSAVHLDEATRALFPAEFRDSAIGRVPSSWEIRSLGSKITLLSGGTPKTSVAEYWEGNIPWYSVKDAPSDSDVWVFETEKNITQLGIENSATQLLPEKTTIISARGTVGKLALTNVPMTMNQSCYGVRGKQGLTEFFTYFLMRSAVNQIQQHTHGTVFDTITRQTFDNIYFCFPPAALAAAFDRAVEPFLLRIRANLYQSRTLSTLRDTLLPKLLNGELEISDDPTDSL